jgi:hypothetical protein
MGSPGGRILLIVIGVIALIAGAIWVGQGTGMIAGSVMTGDRTWLLIGLIVGVVGIVLIALGLRRRPRRR